MKIKKLLIILTIISTLTIGIGASIGYCIELEDPEPWSTEPGTLQN
ncbi:hypothetical protein [Caloranaerobacter azorensis]|uniref:Uncharacterized protein n=1 Tax=Caloranaerobacter azorensis DSM 13643 TaxID=1121264 RepID=A0A1M5T2I7_9FIRM|nr:hypothetical protein [Caloranaerobacter azorensis]SHH45014.1 hypothetical protein SAMN02745135_00837 [Caloranaerobacter azorensis DSM 13643]